MALGRLISCRDQEEAAVEFVVQGAAIGILNKRSGLMAVLIASDDEECPQESGGETVEGHWKVELGLASRICTGPLLVRMRWREP